VEQLHPALPRALVDRDPVAARGGEDLGLLLAEQRVEGHAEDVCSVVLLHVGALGAGRGGKGNQLRIRCQLDS